MTKYKTRQQLFDNAYVGLHKQGFVRSYGLSAGGEVMCLYRSPVGACALGHNMKDSDYSAELEGSCVELRGVRDAAGIDDIDVGFTKDLQFAHDNGYSPDAMRKALKELADEYGLTIPDVS